MHLPNLSSELGSRLHHDSPSFHDIARCRRLVGKLLYLTTTRHYISFSVCLNFYLSSHGQGLVFSGSFALDLQGYIDLDLSSCPDSLRYINSCCFFLGNSLIT